MDNPTPYADPPSGPHEPDATLGGTFKKAGQVAAKQAHKTKLTQITIPAVYFALGKDCYTDGRFRDEFAPLFGQLDDLVIKIKTLKKQQASVVATQGFAEKAKVAANKVKDVAQEKALSVQLNSLLRQLGKTAFEQHGDQSGSPDLTSPIIQALAEVDRLDDAMGTLSSQVRSNARRLSKSRGTNKSWAQPSLLKWAAGLVALLILVGAMLPKTKVHTDSQSATIRDSTPESSSEATPSTSNEDNAAEYKRGYDKAHEAGVRCGSVVDKEIAALRRGPYTSDKKALLIQEALDGNLGMYQGFLKNRDEIAASWGVQHKAAFQYRGLTDGFRDGFNSVSTSYQIPVR